MNPHPDQMPDLQAYKAQLREDMDRFLRTANSHPMGRGGNWAFWALLDSMLKRIPEDGA